MQQAACVWNHQEARLRHGGPPQLRHVGDAVGKIVLRARQDRPVDGKGPRRDRSAIGVEDELASETVAA